MRIRRYYKKGGKYPYTWSDEYLAEMQKKLGRDKAERIDNASYEILLESPQEEREWFDDCCLRIINNPRWYLDHLESLPTFYVKMENIFGKVGEKPKDLNTENSE